MMLLHLLEIYRGPESGVETPSVFPIICLDLKSLFFFLSKGQSFGIKQPQILVVWVAGIPGPRMGKMEFVWMHVCLELGLSVNAYKESYKRNITGSRVCTAPMSC